MSLLAAGAAKVSEIAKGDDPKKAILKAVGNLDAVEIFNDLVLVGTFIRHEKIRGIIRPDMNVAEDEYQGKVGLVLKSGPFAYSDWEDPVERGLNADPGTWVVYAIKDGWPVQINGTPCRFIPYEKLRARIEDPNMVF
jgi:hypothetical protein